MTKNEKIVAAAKRFVETMQIRETRAIYCASVRGSFEKEETPGGHIVALRAQGELDTSHGRYCAAIADLMAAVLFD